MRVSAIDLLRPSSDKCHGEEHRSRNMRLVCSVLAAATVFGQDDENRPESMTRFHGSGDRNGYLVKDSGPGEC